METIDFGRLMMACAKRHSLERKTCLQMVMKAVAPTASHFKIRLDVTVRNGTAVWAENVEIHMRIGCEVAFLIHF